MQRYIQQLIEDLEKAAENPPSPAFIEPPPHLDDLPDVAELALVPFKPISEWTGIPENAFPASYRYGDTRDVQKVIDEIIHLLEAYHIEIVDIPNEISAEALYDAIVYCWDDPVQYLPSTGFDLELCSGDPMTCPYGEYCECAEDTDFQDEDTCNEFTE